MRQTSLKEISDYGFNTIIRRYCGFPKMFTLPCHIEHGWTHLDEPLNTDLRTKKKLMLVINKRRKHCWEKKSTIPVEIIGDPFIHYRRLSTLEKKKDARGTIVFPAHSTNLILAKFNINSYCLALQCLPEPFKPITICLHSDDMILGKDRIYTQNGFHVVTAGNRNDESFCDNFYTLLIKHLYATSNEIGSYTFYAIELGIPFFIYGPQNYYLNHGKDPNHPINHTKTDTEIGSKIYQLFNTGPTIKINQQQIKLVLDEIGINDCISPQTLKKKLLVAYLKTILELIFISVPIKIVKNLLKLIRKSIHLY